MKRPSTFEPDESQIDSLIEFDLKIGDKRVKGLSVEVRQRNRTDFRSQYWKWEMLSDTMGHGIMKNSESSAGDTIAMSSDLLV